MPKTKKSPDEMIDDLVDKIAEKYMSDPLGDPSAGPSELTREDVETWVKSRGWTPLEFLVHTYRNGHMRMGDRIAAAKAVLEYTHRKMPTKLEAEVVGAGIKIDASALGKLSDKELDALEKILSKVGV